MTKYNDEDMIEDFQISLENIPFIDTIQIYPDNSIVKKIIKRGVGIVPKINSSLWIKIEFRYPNGKLTTVKNFRNSEYKHDLNQISNEMFFNNCLITMLPLEESLFIIDTSRWKFNNINCQMDQYIKTINYESLKTLGNILYLKVELRMIKYPLPNFLESTQNIKKTLEYSEVVSKYCKVYLDINNETSFKSAREAAEKAINVLKHPTTISKCIASEGEKNQIPSLLTKQYLNRALFEEHLGMLSESLKSCEEAFKIDKNNIKAHFRKAKVLIRLSKFFEAKDSIKFCLENEPNNPSFCEFKKYINLKPPSISAEDKKKKWTKYQKLIENDEGKEEYKAAMKKQVELKEEIDSFLKNNPDIEDELDGNLNGEKINEDPKIETLP